MAKVSIDNGRTKLVSDDLADEVLAEHWEALKAAMDDALRERAHGELAPCSEREFLSRYLELASEDLVIG